MDLWSKKGLKYSIEHAQAKLAMLDGAATREEEERQVEDGDPCFLRILIILSIGDIYVVRNLKIPFKIADHDGAHNLSDEFI